MTDPDDIDTRLVRLGTATDALLPSSGFILRVMDAIHREPVGLPTGLWALAPRVIAVALFAALGAVFWAVQAEHSVNEAMAVSYGAVEVGW